jgi:outer membrane biosynthesis protein TonB
MERRYYLRGLGLGILITAIIMGAAQRGGGKMSDEEVRQRARELGMIENTVLSESVAEPEADAEQAGTDAAAAEEKSEEAAPADTEPVTEDTPEAAADEQDTQEQTDAEDSQEQADAVDAQAEPEQADVADAQTASEEETEQSNGAQSETKTAASGEAQIFTIDKGDSSVSVAQKLEQAGLISSAASYDRFLCDNGYDKKIRAGEYTIPADAGDEQIARIITGME